MTVREESVRRHSGPCVDEYEHKPVPRIARLVPRMQLRRDEELVDIACGNGMLLSLVHDDVLSYHGVDFSPDFIAVARRKAATSGILPPLDAALWAERLNALARWTDEEGRNFAERARACIVERYTCPHVARSTLAVLRARA